MKTYGMFFSSYKLLYPRFVLFSSTLSSCVALIFSHSHDRVRDQTGDTKITLIFNPRVILLPYLVLFMTHSSTAVMTIGMIAVFNPIFNQTFKF